MAHKKAASLHYHLRVYGASDLTKKKFPYGEFFQL